jgi:hypothetical protein
MATTRKSPTRRTTRTRASTPRSTTSSNSRQGFASRTGKAISDRPVASAAIGTGLVAGIAAAVAGFFAFKKSGKSFSEFSDDVTTRVKDGLSDVGSKAKDLTGRRKDGIDVERPQEEFSQEALTLKETGRKTKGKRPVDPVIEEQTKVGAISY